MNGSHKVAHCCHGSLNCSGRAREKTGEQRRVLKISGAYHGSMNGSGLNSTKQLKAVSHLFGRNFYCPLTASLGLKAMSLVNHPMPDRWQNFSVSSNVSQQQRMVGYHNIRRSRTFTSSMNKALMRVIRTLRAQALRCFDSYHLSWNRAPTNPQRVQIAISRLARVGINHRNCGQHVRRNAVARAPFLIKQRQWKLLKGSPVNAMQARIVLVSF